jgi:hypothetical protein
MVLTIGEEISRLFGEVSDVMVNFLGLNGQSMQQLWTFRYGDGPEFGEATCGNGGRVLSGGCEEIQGGYRMVKSSVDSVGVEKKK